MTNPIAVATRLFFIKEKLVLAVYGMELKYVPRGKEENTFGGVASAIIRLDVCRRINVWKITASCR